MFYKETSGNEVFTSIVVIMALMPRIKGLFQTHSFKLAFEWAIAAALVLQDYALYLIQMKLIVQRMIINKRTFSSALIWTISMITVCAQKPIIDSSVFDKWPKVGRADISSDGNYIVYDDLIGGHDGEPVIVLKAMREKKAISFKGIRSYLMLQNGQQLVLLGSLDSLFILEMTTQKMRFLSRVNDYGLVGKKVNERLWYESIPDSSGVSRLTLYNTTSNKKLFEDSVSGHWINSLGNSMVVKRKIIREGHSLFSWEWNNLNDGVVTKIWEGDAILNYCIDQAGKRLVFITKVPNTDRYILWYYNEGMECAAPRAVDDIPTIDSSLRLDKSDLIFNQDGQGVFFSLVPKKSIKPSLAGVQVDLWNYKDTILREAQVHKVGHNVRYLGWMNIATGEVQQLEKHGMRLFGLYRLQDRINKVLLAKGSGDDNWWRGKNRTIVGLASLQGTGGPVTRNDSPIKIWTNLDRFVLSPQDNYVLHQDLSSGDCFSYEIASGNTRNITEDLRMPKGSVSKGESFFIGGWLPNEKGVLLYDNWDIWCLDPRGAKKPINLTQWYGRQHHIRLRLMDEDMLNGTRDGVLDLSHDGQVLLSAFDTATKYSGYFRLQVGKQGPLTLLTMGPYQYNSPKRAANANAWLVLRESAEEAPNYYYTKDWVHWNVVTDVAPQMQYNWLKTELLVWPLPDGQLCQGILFKPEDLDVHKKYPLLVHYYESLSDELYQYREPAATMYDINIPYFVSRGYVVFVPDIHFRLGYAGESALASVVSGVRYVTKLPWIDSARMGLQGHSLGGYETNYIVTHTHLFAAAEEGAGVSDMISDANGLTPDLGLSSQEKFEMGKYRVFASLWQRPDLYIDGSPIFNADKVTTPLLMMANKQDDAVPWQQGVEFFSALRRCGKKVWMLQYDQGGHGLQPGADALDYTIRIEQFFDYYLKGAPPPKWMTEGVPAEMKGLESGYELDSSGKMP